MKGYSVGVALLLCLLLGSVGCSEGKGYEEEQANEEETPLTVEEAAALVRQEVRSICVEVAEMYEGYDLMNQILGDTAALCNTYEEPLQLFVMEFSHDAQFQKRRTQLVEGSPYAPVYYEGMLEIIPPDSTLFFAAWSEVERDHASFCVGWLGSEMDKNYTFTRKGDGKWYLTEYFFSNLEDSLLQEEGIM